MKELEDNAWFPDEFRNFQTEFIGFAAAQFNVYDAFSKHIQSLHLPVLPMTDLCSGDGNAAVKVFEKCNCFSELTLTDKFPNTNGKRIGKTIYKNKKADVLQMKFEEGNYYTMFNSFHHFSDEEKLILIEKIIASKSSGFFIEIIEPTFSYFTKILLITTIGNLFLAPFVQPFSWKRLFFTYIIPFNIFTISFDGIISVFKSKSIYRYKKLFHPYGNNIEVIRIKNKLAPLIVIQIGKMQ